MPLHRPGPGRILCYLTLDRLPTRPAFFKITDPPLPPVILSYTSLKILRQIYCGPRGCSTQTWSQATCPFSFIARAIIDAFLWVSYKKYCGSVGSCLADSRNTPESGRTNKKIQYIFYYFVCFLCSSHSVVVCVCARGRACARACVRACVCVCV